MGYFYSVKSAIKEGRSLFLMEKCSRLLTKEDLIDLILKSTVCIIYRQSDWIGCFLPDHIDKSYIKIGFNCSSSEYIVRMCSAVGGKMEPALRDIYPSLTILKFLIIDSEDIISTDYKGFMKVTKEDFIELLKLGKEYNSNNI